MGIGARISRLTGRRGGCMTGLKDKISRKAYEIYEKNGRRQGNELVDWLAAEKIIQFEQMLIPATGTESTALLEYKPINGHVLALPFLREAKYRSGKVTKGKISAGVRKAARASAPQHAHR
jgi:hypothetical protein